MMGVKLCYIECVRCVGDARAGLDLVVYQRGGKSREFEGGCLLKYRHVDVLEAAGSVGNVSSRL
jgi:hypothetical protein